jgi:hypothetical protein
MGMALEVGKLVATAWLRENWLTAPWALRTGLAAMIAALMALNAVGRAWVLDPRTSRAPAYD